MHGRSDCDRVVSWAIDHPWAITRQMLDVIAHTLGRRIAGQPPQSFEVRQQPPPAPAPAPGSVAVVPLHGVLAPRMNLLSEISGGATFEDADATIAALVADPKVSAIVLDWDSPGGSVAGATGFAQRLLHARTVKPVVSVANHEMCSAAYWTGACATEVVATPDALVGSVGVYCIHEDLSKYLESEGITLRYISAGKYKVDGNPSEPLSETAEARLQAIVDDAYARFTADVAAGRGTTPDAVRTGYGEGAALTASEAMRAGMIDRIETLDAAIARAASLPPVASPAARRARSESELQLQRECAALGIF